jgi:hypothetical protein
MSGLNLFKANEDKKKERKMNQYGLLKQPD